MIKIAIEIADEARKMHQDYSELSYMAAIRQAKEIFLGNIKLPRKPASNPK
jgi:hypothetical protein